MPILLQLQKLPWKGDGGWKKSVSASFFCLTRRLRVRRKKCVLGHPIARAIAYCQTHYDYGPPKMPLKLAV